MSNYSFCIPTINRSHIVERLLINLQDQQHKPKEVIVVDASEDDLTKAVCLKEYSGLDITYVKPKRRGLTYQRVVGMKYCETPYIFMLDDDVLLESDCAKELCDFLDQDKNDEVAAVGSVIVNDYGKSWNGEFRILKKLGFYSDFTPGRYQTCGEFLQLNFRNPNFSEFIESDFLPAGAAIFRMDVIKKIAPDPDYRFGGEDKHWTLRISDKYTIGVLGRARLFHEHYPGGVRRSPYEQAKVTQENMFIIFNECKVKTMSKSYFLFFTYYFLKLAINYSFRVAKFRFKGYGALKGQFVGLVKTLFIGYGGIKKSFDLNLGEK